MKPLVIGKLKAAWMLFWWAVASAAFFIPISIAGLVGPSGRLAFRLCQGWTWWATFACGVRLEIVRNPALDPARSYIIMCNHQSLFDIPALMLGLGLQFRWIIKRSYMHVPMFGWALFCARHVFIDRSNPKRSLRAMDAAARRLPKGVSIAVFPEGTRSDDGVVREFKSGGFLLAVRNGMPILPVTVNGSWRVLPDKRSLAFRSGTIQMIVGEPIETAGMDRKKLDELVARTRAAIEARLDPDYPQ
jgi:1-acyl-sn-glycerol-3-phosphate acyltransferase